MSRFRAAPFTTRQSALLAVFALSGFTGLIYESIWSHYLKLFLGHAAYAQTLVLAIFMGGMAVGAMVVGRNSLRIRRLLLAYAVVEMVIGVLGLFFHTIFQWFLDWSFLSVIPSLGSPGSVQAFKWTAGAMLILPQSILLGATFPLISGGLVRLAPSRSGELLALLYFTNCLGAALGVLVSGFVLIDKVGLPGTLLTAGLLNILLALLVWFLAKAEPEPAATALQQSAVNHDAQLRWLTAAAFVTGVVAFLYEMAWIRMLSLVLGSSTHSFELMLAAFIFGLAMGGWWIRRRIDHLPDPMRFLGQVLMIMGTLAALTIAGYHYAFDVIAWAMRAFSHTESGYIGFTFVAQSVAIALMVPVTFCAGMTLPLITRLLMVRGAGERAIGAVYALNTIGAIVGVVLAIHLLMPLVGLKGTILVGAALHLSLAVAGRIASGHDQLPIFTRLLAGASVAIVALVAIAIRPDPRRMLSAVYRSGSAEISRGMEVIFLRDGKTATVSLIRSGGTISIQTNGKPDAAIEMGGGRPAADEITMIMAGVLPLSLHPRPRTVANIGIGSGLTSQVLLSTDAVESLTSIEIEPFIVDAARQAYLPRVSRLFEDKRSRIVIDDAKTFFAGAGRQFDVIVSEPSNPWVSGVATLFSDEFYRQIIRYLAPDGMLVQWLQIYETDLSVVVSILKALSPHFQDYHVYNVDDSNILVVAQRGKSVPDPDPAIFASKDLSRELRLGGIEGIEDLTSRRIGNKALLGPFVSTYPVPVNSDYFPYVDQHAARFRFMDRDAIDLPSLTFLPVPFLELALPEWSPRPPESAPEFGQGHRETLENQAGLIAASVAANDYSVLPAEINGLIATLDMPAASCHRDGLGRAWEAAVTDLANRTTSMLPYPELAPLWQKIQTSPCYHAATAAAALWPNFLHAVAERHRPRIAELGRLLLDTPPSEAPKLGYVLTATAAALLGSGQREEAAELVRKWKARLPAGGEYDLAIGILAAADREGPLGTVAAAVPLE